MKVLEERIYTRADFPQKYLWKRRVKKDTTADEQTHFRQSLEYDFDFTILDKLHDTVDMPVTIWIRPRSTAEPRLCEIIAKL